MNLGSIQLYTELILNYHSPNSPIPRVFHSNKVVWFVAVRHYSNPNNPEVSCNTPHPDFDRSYRIQK
uniref:Uncharacterized protein n=1 Tax=Picea glauca TaxID=3330 RepID=A0A101M1X2_PICGL|nr:hypothetical protein ABT39_MTgene2774 [Picea glauca]